VFQSFATEFRQWAQLVLDVDDFDTMIVLDFLDRAQELPRDERVAVEVILEQVGAAQAAQMVDCTDGRYLECLVVERLPAVLPDVTAYLRARDLSTMPYREYLGTPEWAERAAETRRRFGYRCAVCNGEGDLDADHRTYERRGQEETDDLTALCRTCHALFHEWRDLAAVPASA
jgi:phage terminase large subunit GpA-like protein